MLYDPYETEISELHLGKVLKKVRGDVCLLGGWATFQIVGKNFENTHGVGYTGSRDIDLGFHVDRNWTDEQLRASDLPAAMGVLESMGFWPLSFRFAKDFESETRRELSPEESAKLPRHEIFQLYVDPIVDHIHPNIKSILGFIPIDEPLLSLVLSDGLGTTVKSFGTRVLLPQPHVLVAMKLNSVPNRDKEHKRIKDIADLYSLLWFSDVATSQIKEDLFSIYPRERAQEVVRGFNEEDVRRVSAAIDVPSGEIARVLAELK